MALFQFNKIIHINAFYMCIEWRKRIMDFGEFITAFGTGYSKQIDYRTNKRLTKPDFCKDLLCSITKEENLVLYIDGIEDGAHKRGESAFQAFYRNTDRRSLHPIAENIINGNNLDTSKFKKFLEKYVENYAKEKLLTNFKVCLPSASSDTLFDDIINEFVRILKEAAAKPDNRRKEPLSSDIQNCDDDNCNSIEAKLEELLQALIKTGRKIAEFKKTGVSDTVRYLKLKNSLHRDFEQLTLLSDSLSKSNEADYFPIVEDIFDSVMSLEENDFILTADEFIIESMKNYHIHRLSKLLSQSQEL